VPNTQVWITIVHLSFFQIKIVFYKKKSDSYTLQHVFTWVVFLIKIRFSFGYAGEVLWCHSHFCHTEYIKLSVFDSWDFIKSII
jgi:hypothetical protein